MRKLDYYLGNEIVHSVEFEIGKNSQSLCTARNQCHGYGFSNYDFVSLDNGRALIFPGKEDTYIWFFADWLDENLKEKDITGYSIVMEPKNDCHLQCAMAFNK